MLEFGLFAVEHEISGVSNLVQRFGVSARKMWWL
jgi:hypothetical protein